MATIWMDADGHLQWLQVIHRRFRIPQRKAPTKRLRNRCLPTGQLCLPSQVWTPRNFSQPLRNGFRGGFRCQSGLGSNLASKRTPLHVEAAAWRGKPVFFSLTGPWSRPNRTETDVGKGENTGDIIALIVTLLTVAIGVWFAFRNLARGRGDRENAWRVACLTFAIGMVTFLLRVHLVASLRMVLLVLAISTSLFMASALWLLYIALEPMFAALAANHFWWTRLMSGRFRDPLVGRDLIFGILMGLSWILVFVIGSLVRIRMGGRRSPAANYLMGMRPAAGIWLAALVTSILGTLLFFFSLILWGVGTQCLAGCFAVRHFVHRSKGSGQQSCAG